MDLILLYLPLYDPRSTELECAIQTVLGHRSYTILRDFNSLETALLRGLATPCLVVLYISNREDLTRILTLRDELIRSNVVVILPDEDFGSTALVHSIRPRFVGYADHDCRAITEVIARLLYDQKMQVQSVTSKEPESVWITFE